MDYSGAIPTGGMTMRNAWGAAILSLVTVAGGHLYNRRPYTAVLFLFIVVALQSLADMLVPLLLPVFETPGAAGVIRQVTWMKAGALLLVAVISACVSFLNARPGRPKEGEALEVAGSIGGALIGLTFVVMTFGTLLAVMRFDAG